MRLEEAAKSTKDQLLETINDSFKSDEDTFITKEIRATSISWPTFLLEHQEFFSHKDELLIQERANKYKNVSKIELRVERNELKDDLRDIHSECQNIYNLIGKIIESYFEGEVRKISNSKNDKHQKVEQLEHLRSKIQTLVAAYGIKNPANQFLNEGLIFGNIDEFKFEITAINELTSILNREQLTNKFVPGESKYNFLYLIQLLDKAIPKAKDFVAVQYAISNFNELNPYQNNSDKKRWAFLDPIFQELFRKEPLSDQEVLDILQGYDKELTYRPPNGFFTNEIGKAKKRTFSTAFKEIYENNFPGESVTPKAIEDHYDFSQLSI